MSLGNYKIKDTDIASKGVVAAPDKLTGSAEENKKIFDRLIRESVKGLYNGLVDALEELGVEQAVLLPENAAGFKYIRLNSDKVLEVSPDGETWQATGSSGHLILDKDGKQLPQRSRMQFANGTVEDKNGVTVVTSVKGDKGDTGATGAQGPQGVQGVKGERGQVFVPSVNDDGVLSWTVQEPTTTVPASRNIRGPQGIQGVQGIQGRQGATGATGAQGVQGPRGETGPAGKDGADGRSFTIKGMYATLAALMAAHPTGSAGDAYAVGTAESNTVYNWDTEKELWENLGPLRGPQGEQGVQGVQGIQGPQGEQGVQGEQGAQGPQGEQGIQGPEGPQGPRGYPANVNSKTPDDSGAITLTGDDVGAVRYDAAQSLTDAEKTQARGNIGAAPSGGGVMERAPEISCSSASESYDTFCAKLDAVLASMPNQSVKFLGVYPPQYYGFGTDMCALYKNTNDYASVYTIGSYNINCQGFRMVKRKLLTSDPAGRWKPLEYINPEMTAGVEYRTTERYQGKPVYVRAITFGAIPSGSSKSVAHNISNVDAIVALHGVESNGTTLGNQNIQILSTRTDVTINSNVSTTNTAVVILYYTKTTD